MYQNHFALSFLNSPESQAYRFLMISTTEMESPSNTENNTNKDAETTDSSQGDPRIKEEITWV